MGLVYFGKRYLNTSLQRWVSADPLEVHEAGASGEPNAYAYVSGQALRNIDPIGLCDNPGVDCSPSDASRTSESGQGVDSVNYTDYDPDAQPTQSDAPVERTKVHSAPGNEPTKIAAQGERESEKAFDRRSDNERGLDAVARAEPLLLPLVWAVEALGKIFQKDTEEQFRGEDGRTITRTVPVDPAERAQGLAELTFMVTPAAAAGGPAPASGLTKQQQIAADVAKLPAENRVLWQGGPAAQRTADRIAERLGGSTVRVPEGESITAYSLEYSVTAKGKVHSVVGSTNPNSTRQTVELPNVTERGTTYLPVVD